MNGEQSGFNRDVIVSLTNDSKSEKQLKVCSNDRSSFFIGLPKETNNTYQLGLMSSYPINFQINVSQETGENTYAGKVETPSLICLLFDSLISILFQPNGMSPMVRFDCYDL